MGKESGRKMKREGRIQSYSVKEEILGVIKAAGKKRLSAYKETQPAGHRVPKNSGFAILEIQVLCTQVSRNKNDKERGPSPVSLSCTCPTENCARSRFPPFGNSATNTKTIIYKRKEKRLEEEKEKTKLLLVLQIPRLVNEVTRLATLGCLV